MIKNQGTHITNLSTPTKTSMNKIKSKNIISFIHQRLTRVYPLPKDKTVQKTLTRTRNLQLQRKKKRGLDFGHLVAAAELSSPSLQLRATIGIE